MMMKRMWYELNILALRKHVRPVSLFLLVHTLLWCDLTWLICQIGCDILEMPKALYQMNILLITAYAGVFGGLIGLNTGRMSVSRNEFCIRICERVLKS